MSRALKKGLSYFPLDTDFVRDTKIQRLMLEFGCEGLSVFTAVLCEVYASQGYYVEIKGGFYPAIGFLLGLDDERVKQIVRLCLELDLFDKGLYESCGILTSYGVQQRFGMIYKQGKNLIKPGFLILREEAISELENTSHININKNIEVKIKGKGKGKEKENINTNENKTGIDYGKEQRNTANDESARRAELLQMAAAATRGGNDV